MTKKTFYITTAIDYVNAEPHIGHAYQKIVADVLARWHKLQGKEVYFLTGTDEHGKKVAEAAKKANLSPEEFTDKISTKFKQAWELLNIKSDRFIRTTDPDHKKVVQDIIKKVNEKGDIYKGFYEGYYCINCEAYYTEQDAPDLICPFHKKPLEKLKEETYFFKLSKYQNFLLDLYKKHPEFALPDIRRNEVISRVKEGLQDLSISRTSFDWGVPFPLDKKHVTYVWFDALLNYYTPTTNSKLKKFWPADLHILGKDNTWFHCVYWPAMLKAAGLPLPKTVFNHGFLTFNSQKISKSLGNAISIPTLVERYGTDTIRYFAIRQFPFATGHDGDFSEQALIDRHNNELADKLGNLISRVSALAEKYPITKTTNSLVKKLNQKAINKYFDNYELDKALNEIFAFIDNCNEYVQSKKPWETHDTKILYELADSIKAIAILLSPFIPETSEKIAKIFNFKIALKELNKPLSITKITKAPILFQKVCSPQGESSQRSEKLRSKSESDSKQKLKSNEELQGITTMSSIPFNEFSKIDLRVAQIKKAEDIEGKDKLYKLQIDLGKEKRTIVAGIKEHYTKPELKNKKIIVVANLEPATLAGIESNGMLLAAVSEDHKNITLIKPKQEVKEGAKIEFQNE